MLKYSITPFDIFYLYKNPEMQCQMKDTGENVVVQILEWLYSSLLFLFFSVYFIVSKMIRHPEMRGYLISVFISVVFTFWANDPNYDYIIKNKFEDMLLFKESLQEPTKIYSSEKKKDYFIVTNARYSIVYVKHNLARILLSNGRAGWIDLAE